MSFVVRVPGVVLTAAILVQVSFGAVLDAGSGLTVDARDDVVVLRASCKPSDTLGFVLCPTGKDFDFYRFTVSGSESGGKSAEFASEGGNIHPDPYAPVWRVRRNPVGETVALEVEIPLSSFYMTRNDAWSTDWLVGLERDRTGTGKPSGLRTVASFPKRRSADDVALTDVVALADGISDGKVRGSFKVTAFVREGGDYEFVSALTGRCPVKLRSGRNRLSLPCAFSQKGRLQLRLGLVRKATGERYAREYPVLVDYEEVSVRFSCPEYRDGFYPGQDATRVTGVVRSAVRGGLRLVLEGPGFGRREATLPDGGGSFDFDTTGFSDGEAWLTVTADGTSVRRRIRKLAPSGRKMSWISKGRLVVDGKPVLRRNFYARGYCGGTALDEKVAADPRLGTTDEVVPGPTLEPDRVIPGLGTREATRDIVPCKEYFDKIDAVIERWRGKDFAYYYISDEPECRGLSPVYLKHIYDHVTEKDPYHVLLTASRGGRKYLDCADWFETHPYLNPHDDGHGNRRYGVRVDEMGSYLDAFEAWDRPDKCIGFIPTLFAYRGQNLLNDYPTFREYVCHVWAAMMRGGKSLFPYAYHDMGDRPALYEGNRYVFTSFGALSDFILDGRRTSLLATPQAECVRWDLDGRSLFALVNLTPEKQFVSVKGLDGSFREFRGDRTFGASVGQSSSFTLQPFEVIIGTTEACGKGLPSLAETGKLIADLEYERTHRDNQLLENYTGLAFASSIAQKNFYKLVDGVRDVYAWCQHWTKNPYVEFSFPQGSVFFSCIRVYGTGLDGMEVRIRKGGEWRTLVPRRSKEERFMRELDFGETHSTVKVRISFPSEKSKTTELYEVEIPRVAEGAAPAARKTIRTEADALPETDALWSFDGSNADWSNDWSGSKWYGGAQAVFPRADGKTGFAVRNHATHVVTYDPAYPWIEMRVDSFADIDGNRYKAWNVRGVSKEIGYLFGTVTHPQAGLYTVRLPEFAKRFSDYVRISDYNLEMAVRYLRNVKKPANLLSATKTETSVEISLELAKPCEDVSAMFVRDAGNGGGFQAFSVNGTSTIELKAADESGRLWRASVPISSSGKASRRQVYVKCQVLGGTLDIPIFTNVNAEF